MPNGVAPAPDPSHEVTATIAPQPAAAPAPQPSDGGGLAGTSLGHFQLKEVLGRGGMGVVYRALDIHLQRAVALKLLPPERSADDQRRRLFLREAQAAAAVSHPNVAAIYEVGEDRGQSFIAMELVEGQTLRSRLAAELPLDQALRIALQIARGISRAHESGVLHRDLKPENVMVGADDEVKILDFGLARRVLAAGAAHAQHDGARDRVIMGTPGYMSPEQARGDEVDHRTDLFSFGVVLYELATGRRPFARTFEEYVEQVTAEERPAPSQRNRRVTPELERIILRCLARRPEDRYPTARQLCADLEQLHRRSPGAPEAGRGGIDPEPTSTPPAAFLPSGTVTLLSCGVEEREQLLQALGDGSAAVFARQGELLRQAVERSGGHLVESAHEGSLFAFSEARGALAAAVAAQRALHSEPWPQGAGIHVRMGLHTGVPRRAGDHYVGLDVHRAECIAGAARGGHLLLSATTRALLRDEDLEGLTVRELGAHRLADLRYPEHLFGIGIPGVPLALAPLQTFSLVRHNLPSQPTAFVGREAQIAQAAALLRRPETRLVTITGVGGTGKTRLSLEVGRALLADFPGGVLQVPLAPVADPALVPATIAQVLDVPLLPGRPVSESLKARIGQERMLLLLDNFEQVVAATPEMADLLTACPNLKLLVTSRQPLKLRGEREYALPPMQLPPADAAGSVDALVRCESVRLFVDRVRDTQPDFELTPDNAPTVSAICTRLEGLPLALELAASRTKMLTLPALHTRLGDRLGFLKGGARDAAERHQTLRAAIDWSYNLLDESEKVLFRRAAVFTGGFFIESAEDICDFSPGPALDVLSGLGSLVDKSLLTRGEVDGEPRLGLLETIREYALAQLRPTADYGAARARHAAHFLALAEAMAPGLTGHDQRRCVGRLLTEADNIRAALAWALEQPSPAATSRLLRALLWLWLPQGQLTEGREWAARAIQQARRSGPSRELADVLDVAGWLAFLSGDLASGLPLCRESVALFEALGDELAAARAKIALGATSSVGSPIEESLRTLNEALAVCRKHSDAFGAGLALNALGEQARGEGNHDRARACYEEAIPLLSQSDNLFMSSLLTVNLVHLYLRKGDWRTAAKLLAELIALGLEFNYPMVLYLSLGAMGGIAVLRGRAAEGVRLFAAVERMIAGQGLALEPADEAEWRRHLEAAREALGEEGFAAARREGARWTRDEAIAAAAALRA